MKIMHQINIEATVGDPAYARFILALGEALAATGTFPARAQAGIEAAGAAGHEPASEHAEAHHAAPEGAEDGTLPPAEAEPKITAEEAAAIEAAVDAARPKRGRPRKNAATDAETPPEPKAEPKAEPQAEAPAPAPEPAAGAADGPLPPATVAEVRGLFRCVQDNLSDTAAVEVMKVVGVKRVDAYTDEERETARSMLRAALRKAGIAIPEVEHA